VLIVRYRLISELFSFFYQKRFVLRFPVLNFVLLACILIRVMMVATRPEMRDEAPMSSVNYLIVAQLKLLKGKIAHGTEKPFA
jgi:uncharacterized membrane protein YoaT (DUF817 family)